MTLNDLITYFQSLGVFSNILKGAVLILVLVSVLSVGKNVIVKYFKSVLYKRKNVNKVKTIEKVVVNIYKLVVIFIGTAIFLDEVLGVDISSILTVAGVSGIAVGFASQTIIKDFLAGIMILLEDTITIGDSVEVNGYHGVVENITLRSISLRDENDVLHVIPNNTIRNFTNYSRKTVNK